MANEIGSFVVSLQAKVEGYEAEIEKVKKALQAVGANTNIGKDIAKQLKAAEAAVDALGRKMTQRISSEGQITRLKDTLDGIDTKFMQIGQSLQQVSYKDLDPDYITNKFKDLESELETIGQKMQSNFNLDSLKGNEKLLQLFKDLGISVKDINLDNFKSTLTSALEDSKKKASEYRAEIERLKKTQSDLNSRTRGNALFADENGAANVANKLIEGIDPSSFKTLSQSAVDEMKQSLMQAVDSFDNKELADKLKAQLEQSFNVSDLGTLQNNLKTLLKDMVTAAGGDLEKNTQTFLREKLNAALSNLGIDFNLSDILNLKNYTVADSDVLEVVRERLTSLLEVNNDLNKDGDKAGEFIEKQMAAFSSGDYAGAIRAITQALIYYVNTVKTAQEETGGKLNLAIEGRDAANNMSARINGMIAANQKKIADAQAQNQALLQMQKELEGKAINEPQTLGGGISDSAAQSFRESAQAAAQYRQQLDSVKDAEKLVGNIQNIVQRWFSVYAAVRMVSSAINSMRQTIAELDKSITEIAIVTDMSQSDLWGQMGQYTSLAREYAASISGVYQVSQLYYQQGLQTADVMALTEQTLKMARISGLDYAEATDYRRKCYVA